MDPMQIGPYRAGPYEPWREPPPIERRCIQRGEFGLEYTGCMSSVVDPFARHKYDVSIRDSLFTPKPPDYTPEKQGPGKDICDEIGSHLVEEETRHRARTDFRRQHALAREQGVVTGRDDEYLRNNLMVDQHRERIMAQLERDRQRQLDEINRVEATREAKKKINADIRAKIEENQQKERQQEEGRYEYMRAERQRREDIVKQRQQEYEAVLAKRQELKEQRAAQRNEAIQTRMVEQESQQAARDEQLRNAKLHRRQHYRQLEADNQLRQRFAADPDTVHMNQWRSQVLSRSQIIG